MQIRVGTIASIVLAGVSAAAIAGSACYENAPVSCSYGGSGYCQGAVFECDEGWREVVPPNTIGDTCEFWTNVNQTCVEYANCSAQSCASDPPTHKMNCPPSGSN